MRRGSVTAPEPDTNSATTSSSNDVMKANRAPTRTPGRISGSVIWKKVPVGVAPRLSAACSRRGSMPARLAFPLVTTKGTPSQVGRRRKRDHHHDDDGQGEEHEDEAYERRRQHASDCHRALVRSVWPTPGSR